MSAVLAAGLLLATLAAGQSKSAPAFERLKSLQGEWEGTLPDGKTSRVTYKLVSNGTALLESIGGDEHPDGMITIYHLDGDSILATHYCSMGNQPRFRARPGAGEAITFALVDVSNLEATGPSHISGLTVRFEDARHFTQEWSSIEKGQTTKTVFRWTRRK
jgi:hypothetical protein